MWSCLVGHSAREPSYPAPACVLYVEARPCRRSSHEHPHRLMIRPPWATTPATRTLARRDVTMYKPRAQWAASGLQILMLPVRMVVAATAEQAVWSPTHEPDCATNVMANGGIVVANFTREDFPAAPCWCASSGTTWIPAFNWGRQRLLRAGQLVGRLYRGTAFAESWWVQAL